MPFDWRRKAGANRKSPPAPAQALTHPCAGACFRRGRAAARAPTRRPSAACTSARSRASTPCRVSGSSPFKRKMPGAASSALSRSSPGLSACGSGAAHDSPGVSAMMSAAASTLGAVSEARLMCSKARRSAPAASRSSRSRYAPCAAAPTSGAVRNGGRNSLARPSQPAGTPSDITVQDGGRESPGRFARAAPPMRATAPYRVASTTAEQRTANRDVRAAMIAPARLPSSPRRSATGRDM